ncbi:AAA domain-containing protein [Actinomadura keratinilytica]|uniref:AAA domain-containing protein n=1 Tax=Actinomadura keratinilytica TaxID=547461 RepID=A0ABP7Z699_9ACTN
MADGHTGPGPVEEFLRAVDAEITAVLHDARSGAEKVSLRDGRLTGRTGDEREYLFSCARWNEGFAVKDLLVRPTGSRRPWAQAEVTRLPGGKVRVVTEADLGERCESAQLVEDETAGLRALAERLRQVQDGKGPVNPTAAGWMLGQGTPRVGHCIAPDRYIRRYRDRRLNERQRRAVEQALGSEVTFVWGPPGTGKTDVVACIVEGCYRQGLHTLFLAPTHVAVDQALERMCDLLSGEQDFDSGLVQRAGDIAVPSLADRYGEQIDPKRIADRLATALETQITQVTARLEETRAAIAVHEEAARLSAELDDLQGRLRTLDEVIADAGRWMHTTSGRARDVERRIAEIGVPSGLFAQRKQAKLDALHHELARHRQAYQNARRRHGDAQADRARCAADLASLESALAPLLTRARGLAPVERLRREAERLDKRLDELDKERRRIEEAVRNRCRVMGTTVSKAVQSRSLMGTVDVVVIDEAGMVDLPSVWCAAGLAARRVVVAGDFRQLPAVTHGSSHRLASEADHGHSRLWMDRDAFHAAGLVDARGGAVQSDPRMVALNEQYRMRPAICAVVNEVAYPDAPLRTGRPDTCGLPASPLLDSPLVLIDTSSRVLKGTGSQAHLSNPVHEAVIHELIRGLQYDSVLPPRGWRDLPAGKRPTDLLAVIAPYKNQKRILDTSLKHRFGEAYDGLVDTVHRFQGSQRPLVVIDTVAGAGRQLGYFYQDVGLSSRTCRLLNVALSRAQDHLVVVANVAFLRRELRADSEAARMLDHLERHAQRLPVEDLVPVRSAADLGELDEEELARPAFFPADEVARAVEWDIARARSSIDIFCAFLSPGPVRHWLRRLAPGSPRGSASPSTPGPMPPIRPKRRSWNGSRRPDARC